MRGNEVLQLKRVSGRKSSNNKEKLLLNAKPTKTHEMITPGKTRLYLIAFLALVSFIGTYTGILSLMEGKPGLQVVGEIFDFSRHTPQVTTSPSTPDAAPPPKVVREASSSEIATRAVLFLITLTLTIAMVYFLFQAINSRIGTIRVFSTMGYVLLMTWSVLFGFTFWWTFLASRGETLDRFDSALEQIELGLRSAASTQDRSLNQLDNLRMRAETTMKEEEDKGGTCGGPQVPGQGPQFRLRDTINNEITDLINRLNQGVLTFQGKATQRSEQIKVDREAIAAMSPQERAEQIENINQSYSVALTDLNDETRLQFNRFAAEIRALAAKMNVEQPNLAQGFCSDRPFAGRLVAIAQKFDSWKEIELPNIVSAEGANAITEAMERLLTAILGSYVAGKRVTNAIVDNLGASQDVKASAAADQATTTLKPRDLLALFIALIIDSFLVLTALTIRRQPLAGGFGGNLSPVEVRRRLTTMPPDQLYGLKAMMSLRVEHWRNKALVFAPGVGWSFNPNDRDYSEDEALSLELEGLEERLARGEITENSFKRLKYEIGERFKTQRDERRNAATRMLRSCISDAMLVLQAGDVIRPYSSNSWFRSTGSNKISDKLKDKVTDIAEGHGWAFMSRDEPNKYGQIYTINIRDLEEILSIFAKTSLDNDLQEENDDPAIDESFGILKRDKVKSSLEEMDDLSYKIFLMRTGCSDANDLINAEIKLEQERTELKSFGLITIGERNEKYEPALHRVHEKVHDDDVEAGGIAEVITFGLYLAADPKTVLRRALVTISRGADAVSYSTIGQDATNDDQRSVDLDRLRNMGDPETDDTE